MNGKALPNFYVVVKRTALVAYILNIYKSNWIISESSGRIPTYSCDNNKNYSASERYSMAPPGIEPSSQERNFTGSLIRIFLECTGTLQRHTVCTTYLILTFLGSWSSSKTIRERPTCRHTTRHRTWILFRSQYPPQESWVYLSISVEKRSNKETKFVRWDRFTIAKKGRVNFVTTSSFKSV